ncbi:retron system putative HNH endonuclease [Taibaiella soli]|uniref:TIGR02646 family protein n=1 Tax=Taibaiella soli TaxID=1649169 RepID=A0A2W2C0G7_9BACT|nr:retron system putative HNH endonuclease [Taibaiella soli]PZF73563.1 TIGR02646 family protein [Taibaiella soli]
MRKINKAHALASFCDFSHQNPGADWNIDFSRPGARGHPIYIDTRTTILIGEQDCICGYSEIPIEDERDCHIDHFRKRSMFPQDTFNWNNLIAACNHEAFGAKYKDNKSGIRQLDYANIFDPVVDAVQNYFYYNERGEIEPHPKLSDLVLRAKVQKTIEVFNLQDKSLVNRRKTIIEQIKSYTDLTQAEIFNALISAGFVSLIEQYTS